MLNSTFTEENLEKEKKVVIEEIRMYQDMPEDLVHDMNSLPFDNLKKSLEEYDLVISLNLLNQLDILLCDYLKEKFKIDNEETLLPIRKIIQQNHLDILPVNKTKLS